MSEDGRSEPAPSVETQSELAELLALAGVPEDDIREATEARLLPLLAVESLAMGQGVHDLDEVAERTGLGVERLRVLWGALGLAVPRAGERVFTETDVEQLSAVADLVDSGLADPDIVIQLTRVLGSSMSRLANAQTDLIANRAQTGEVVMAGGADWFGDRFTDILDQVWRRHLQAAARSRLTGPLRGELATGMPEQAIGFADLVGFTALSQQLDAAALASVVDRFETVAYATVGIHGGRVVKMIGDEVMFAIADPVAAARCALDLAESYHAADDLSDVRVGMAWGAAIDRDGDLFGPPVNLASRITGIAYPGAVVIDDELRQRLPDGEFSLRAMLPRRLKHIGMVRLHVLRPREERDGRTERRERRRARVAELLAEVVPGRSNDDDEPG